MFNDPISTAFMILAVILAVIAGLWFGSVLGESAAGTREKDRDGKPRPRRSFGKALQSAATTAAFSAWKWQRSRKKRADDRDEPER